MLGAPDQAVVTAAATVAASVVSVHPVDLGRLRVVAATMTTTAATAGVTGTGAIVPAARRTAIGT